MNIDCGIRGNTIVNVQMIEINELKGKTLCASPYSPSPHGVVLCIPSLTLEEGRSGSVQNKGRSSNILPPFNVLKNFN